LVQSDPTLIEQDPIKTTIEELNASTVIAVRLLQPPNAEFPMVVTLLGMVTLVRLMQATERPDPMFGDAVAIVTLVRLAQQRTPRPRCR